MADYTSANNEESLPTEVGEKQDPNPKALRHAIGRRVKSIKKYTHKKFKDETKSYIAIYRNEFRHILPERLLKMDDIDVNIAFPIIKSLIPALYFKDPQVYAKAGQKTINEETDEIDPNTQMPVVKQYDGPTSAFIFQNSINQNMRSCNLKQEAKDVLLDAHVAPYGALKCGWGNDQGVASMGDGAPPAMSDDVREDLAYGIRLKPWDVFVDMDDFYHPAWIAVRYEVHPEQLKKDTRLKNNKNLKGNCEPTEDTRRDIWSDLDKGDFQKTEYFEYYHKPCAEYPEGIFALFTDEVADDFLYFGPWPYAKEESRKTFPVKILYFNRDPEGGLPIPDMRYYAQQQKAKSLIRRAMYEWVQRTMPVMVFDKSKFDEAARQQLASGQLPRMIGASNNAEGAMAAKSFPTLSTDFSAFDLILDADVTRMVGNNSGGSSTGKEAQFSSQIKETAANEQLRNSERADTVRDFMLQVVKFWGALYQEFAGPENYTVVDGEEFPIQWAAAQIQGRFFFDIKPFSMNYEDPTILRRQWLDLFNLMVGPATAQALATQGASPDYLAIMNKMLLTYDEPDVKSFVIDGASKAEAQVAQALAENQAILAGQPAQVMPTDNDQVHIMIHGLLGGAAHDHMVAHQQKMLANAPQKPGGGNPEGMPVNGNAASQEQLMEPLEPSAENVKAAETREGTATR